MTERRVYQPKFEPREAQREALVKMRAKDAFALLLAPRTGKTKTIIDDFGRMELVGWCDTLCVVAPGGVYKTWVGAFKDHASDDLFRRTMVLVWDSSDTKAKRNRLIDAFMAHEGPRVMLINIEALSVVEDARLILQDVLAATDNGMLVIDESTSIKNPKAERAKFVCGIGKKYRHDPIRRLAKWRRILSGLPTPRSPLDIYMQMYFLNPRILRHESFYTFRNEYAVLRKMTLMNGSVEEVLDNQVERNQRTFDIVVGYRNQDKLKRLIEPYMHRVEFRPKIPTTYDKIEVPFTDEQQHHYQNILEYATTQISELEHVTATVVIAQIMKLHTICQGFMVDDDRQTVHQLRENKSKAVMDLLDRTSGKTIIWCSYHHSINKLYNKIILEYGTPAVARFWGGNRSEREAEERRFKTDPLCNIMLATPHAGGMGRTWDVADTVIYHSSTNDLEKRDQSEQRPMGVEKERGVYNWDVFIPNTVEWKILQALRKKINMAGAITGDNWRSWLI